MESWVQRGSALWMYVAVGENRKRKQPACPPWGAVVTRKWILRKFLWESMKVMSGWDSWPQPESQGRAQPAHQTPFVGMRFSMPQMVSSIHYMSLHLPVDSLSLDVWPHHVFEAGRRAGRRCRLAEMQKVTAGLWPGQDFSGHRGYTLGERF